MAWTEISGGYWPSARTTLLLVMFLPWSVGSRRRQLAEVISFTTSAVAESSEVLRDAISLMAVSSPYGLRLIPITSWPSGRFRQRFLTCSAAKSAGYARGSWEEEGAGAFLASCSVLRWRFTDRARVRGQKKAPDPFFCHRRRTSTLFWSWKVSAGIRLPSMGAPLRVRLATPLPLGPLAMVMSKEEKGVRSLS